MLSLVTCCQAFVSFCCPSPSFVVVFVDSPRLLLFVVVFLWLFQHHICLSECAQMDKVWILHTMLRALPTDLHAIPTKGLDVQLGRVRPILRERLAEVPSLGEEVEVMEVGLEGSVVGVKFRWISREVTPILWFGMESEVESLDDINSVGKLKSGVHCFLV